MAGNKSSISNAGTYEEIGEYWDTHELPEDSEEVHFIVDLKSSVHYVALESSLSESLRTIAKKHGVSAETMLNLWIKEKISSEMIET